MKIKKKYYTWSDVEKMCVSIVNQMYADNWKPDYIVGITRGGNVPATIISNMTGIKCRALDVSFRDGGEVISDNGMKADAHAGKKILIVTLGFYSFLPVPKDFEFLSRTSDS